MTGWLVNDKLRTIPGTVTFWDHLLASVPGLVDKTTGDYMGLPESIEAQPQPDYIIRNAAYFRKMNVPTPTVSLVQDIILGDFPRASLVDVCKASQVTVFNSEYTRAAYPELAAVNHKIIPLGSDDFVFYPAESDGSIPCHAVMWIGSGHNIKGFDLACYLASNSPRPWVFVMKDDADVPVSSHVFRKITHEQIAAIASSCAVGVCTSREETQHLAGIEMGLCGLPMVTTDVGVYHGRKPGAWGSRVEKNWHEDIEAAALLDRTAVREYWIDNGFGLDACMNAWRGLVASLEPAHVIR